MNDILIYNESLNISGVLIGAYCFVNILLARWICIVGEYHFSKRLWIAFLLFGIGTVSLSLFIPSFIISSLFSITGFTYLWGVHEVIEQENRVAKGWYPKKPKRL
ncbi:MAG: DUF4491 family protein [Bacteroidales bacterium]|jgi:hypothetical protein|nr:DUF4491 family protein [Bacteroidales bacterium]NLK81938.1 DUF4491 family protein [Bacteroidales bacterium]